MHKYIFTPIFIIPFLFGCHSENQSLPIYPASLINTSDIELGEAIIFLMPNSSEEPFWDWRSNSNKIFWIDNGYKENEGISSRRGLMRINVLGTYSTVLHQKKEELGWTIEMITKEPPKFGPTKINFEPGLGRSDQCFGSLYTGCSFNSLPSMKKAGLDVKEVCEIKQIGGGIKGYQISASGKNTSLLQERYSEGSGGTQTRITLIFSADTKKACIF